MKLKEKSIVEVMTVSGRYASSVTRYKHKIKHGIRELWIDGKLRMIYVYNQGSIIGWTSFRKDGSMYGSYYHCEGINSLYTL